jgi:hypothetical protein
MPLGSVSCEAETNDKAERLEGSPASAWPAWIRPLADYDRRETTIAAGRIYG